MKTYWANAFVGKKFKGNPAAVCPLESWPNDSILQNIAKKNNVSETAFFIRDKQKYHLRWFTPTTEVKLCGHATMACAAVIFKHFEKANNSLLFSTLSGDIAVTQRKELISMIFPQEKNLIQTSSPLFDCECFLISDHSLLAVFENESLIKEYIPDLNLIESTNLSVVITAKSSEADFVSRCFCPHEGINEDPVTGSNHCFLAPFWAKRLQKQRFLAHQLSAPGGELKIQLLENNKLEISGQVELISK